MIIALLPWSGTEPAGSLRSACSGEEPEDKLGTLDTTGVILVFGEVIVKGWGAAIIPLYLSMMFLYFLRVVIRNISPNPFHFLCLLIF